MIINDVSNRGPIMHPYVYWDGFFTDEEIKLITEYCENKKMEKGAVIGKENEAILNKIRISNVNFTTPDEENRWIFDKFNFFIQMINEKFYGFDLVGYNSFQFSTYKSKEKGKYGWHTDSFFGREGLNKEGFHRKLSMSFLLNDDFEGGDFEINTGNPLKVELKKGRAIFFPSFFLHQVTPVTKGTRKSIVIWVDGPRWK